ncbi:16S rRNA (uracil(1498)-N(3))-methyltransferase [Luedemannella helvata]|uniref:Ribosomal RNA small subunit methyltransferase E n=1 Tax=Luedemannella helvata TaxID=349315 RepID=A0ABN2KJ93_9ACTN
MSKPLFLVSEVPSGELCTLDGPEGHHAATVQRLRVGEELILADGRGATASAVVTAVGRGTLSVRVVAREYAPPHAVRLVVAQGIAKGDRGELAVQAMTEVGVDEIVPWAAARSVVRWREERGERSRQRWVDTAREAAKQARRPWLPVVAEAASTTVLAARLRSAALGLVLHESATAPLAAVELPAAGEVVLVIGPEGGVASEELAAFEAAGARAVRLGPEVLRTSTAGVAALAVLSARLGRWA